MKFLANLKTMTKLICAFLVMALISAWIGYEGISSLKEVNVLVDKMDSHADGMRAIQESYVQVLKAARTSRDVILAEDAKNVPALAASIETAYTEMQAKLEEAAKTIVSEEGKKSVAEIRELHPKWIAATRELVKDVLAGDREQAKADVLEAKKASVAMEESILEVLGQKTTMVNAAKDEATAAYETSRSFLITVIAIGSLLGMALGYGIARVIVKPLQRASDALGQVANGDFTQVLHIETKDEVGLLAQSLDRCVAGIRGVLQDVRTSANAVTSASQQLAAGSEEISSGAQEQASSLEETAASLEEMTSTIKQNADNAQQASQLASGARDVAENGGRVVKEAVEAMKEINASSKRIADIITTIDEIAFQTNLLALNAAVEAARAGEQGRGFAVVAAEVRNLAQRSASSAKEIKGLIQDSVRKVEGGTELVNRSGETLSEIVGSVKRVSDIVVEMAAASREQSSGIDQINKAVAQMDQVTQSNASQTEELSGTAEQLASQAEDLMALVRRFKLEEANARQETRASAPKPPQPEPQAPRSSKPHVAADVHKLLAHDKKPAHEPQRELAGVGSGPASKSGSALDHEFEAF